MSDYIYIEYPKWVSPDGGEPVLVQDAAEEAAVMPKTKRGRPAKVEDAPDEAPVE